jgi:AcrR family transcriptional regulator
VTAASTPNVDPRVARTRAAVLGAAIDLLAERGYSGFSVEGVVERTGIAKTTLYRHWPTRDDLLAAAIARLDGAGLDGSGLDGSGLDGSGSDGSGLDSAGLDGAGSLPDTGSVRQDLLDLQARRVRAARTTQWERCMPALVEAAAHHPELAEVIARLTGQILAQIEILLARGVERGELRDGLDPQLVASALIGPIVFRRLLLHEVPTLERVADVIDLLMQGIAVQGPADAWSPSGTGGVHD